MDARPGRPGPGPDQGRGQPSLRDRRERDPAHDRGAAGLRALGRDGPARGRRAPGRGAGDVGLRHPLGARPARLRGAGRCAPSPGPCSSPCRTSTRCSSAFGAGARPPRPSCASSSGRHSPTGARRCAGSLALAPEADPGVRDRARAALEAMGRPAGERAERLSPEDFRELAGPAVTALTTRAPGKVNLCLYVGPTPPRRTARAGVRHPAARRWPTSCGSSPPEADEVICEGVEGENLAGRALDAYREAAGLSAPLAPDDRQARPGGRGDGRRLERRRRGASPRRPRRGAPRGPPGRAARARARGPTSPRCSTPGPSS